MQSNKLCIIHPFNPHAPETKEGRGSPTERQARVGESYQNIILTLEGCCSRRFPTVIKVDVVLKVSHYAHFLHYFSSSGEAALHS